MSTWYNLWVLEKMNHGKYGDIPSPMSDLIGYIVTGIIIVCIIILVIKAGKE